MFLWGIYKFINVTMIIIFIAPSGGHCLSYKCKHSNRIFLKFWFSGNQKKYQGKKKKRYKHNNVFFGDIGFAFNKEQILTVT